MSAAHRPGLVSVVVTSYNHAKFLARRMDSLLQQTYQDIEILVIDDCSTEGNAEILQAYQSHPNVRLLFNKRNAGLVPAMNQGIELTSGEFVLIAQCDDDCDPRMIERLADALKTHPTAGMAFCRSQLVGENDEVLGDDFSPRESSFRTRCATDTLVSGAEMSRFLLHSCVIPNMSALMLRRDCLAAVGSLSSDFVVCVDWDYFLRVTARYDVAYVAEPLNRFRQHRSTLRSTTKDRITYEEYFRVLLSRIRTLDLSAFERCRFRTRVMYLWAVHLISPTWSGLANFPYHAGVVFRHDPAAFVFLGLGLALRFAQVLGKLAFGRHRRGAARAMAFVA
jgi:glycosyltransferase involved in cell wall biosynthesis